MSFWYIDRQAATKEATAIPGDRPNEKDDRHERPGTREINAADVASESASYLRRRQLAQQSEREGSATASPWRSRCKRNLAF